MATVETRDEFPQAMSIKEYFALSHATADTKYEYAHGKQWQRQVGNTVL